MTSVVQPHDQPAAPAELEPPALNGAEPLATDGVGRVSFPELVWAHYKWRKAVGQGSVGAELEKAYYSKLRSFEQEHGRIVNAYWCLNVASAVALTEKPRPGWLRKLGLRPTHIFHRVTDWATRDKPAIAAGLHRCDELAIRAEQVLKGPRRRIALQMVMACAGHLLSAADEKATGRDVRKMPQEEKRELDACAQYYCDAANGQAQMIYFAGMGVFTLFIGLLAVPSAFFVPLPGIDDREFFGALLAGALGAVVSVVARINSGRFDLEYDVGRVYPFFLGGLRPLLGGAFGLVLYFAVASGRLDIIELPAEGTPHFFAILVVAFAAGFSERWAKDTLAVAAGTRPSGDARSKGAAGSPEAGA
jgi:hypothetical protein